MFSYLCVCLLYYLSCALREYIVLRGHHTIPILMNLLFTLKIGIFNETKNLKGGKGLKIEMVWGPSSLR